MKRPIPFHPPLIAVFPIFSLYSANLGMFNPDDLLRPLAVWAALSIALWVVAGLAFRDAAKGAMAASVLMVCYIVYGRIFHAPAGALAVTVWLVVSLGLAFVAAVRWSGTFVLNTLGVCLIGSSLGSIGYAMVKVQTSHEGKRPPLVVRPAGPNAPDVFYVILDCYGRHDSLKQFLGYDNEPFLDALRRRGFYIADQSHSNYVQTEISIPSSLDMDFIPNLLPQVDRQATERVSLDQLTHDNEVFRQFKARGYESALVTTGFPVFQPIPADIVMRFRPASTLFETTLGSSSPLATKQADDEAYEDRRKALLTGFQDLERLAVRDKKPKVAFVHILAPHPPFVFDAKGRPIRPPYPYAFWDGSDFIAAGQTSEDYKEGYDGQVQTIDRLVLQAVDVILAKEKIKPIIILQGDHGSKRFLDQQSLQRTDLRECFSNLEAFYGPEPVQKLWYPSITPVNEFRVILNGLFDAKMPLLPDRSWYSPQAYPYAFVDVTDAVVAYGQHKTVASSRDHREPPVSPLRRG